jgi:hypothetical protein
MGVISRDFVNSALDKCGVIALKTEDNKTHLVTTNKNILRHVYIFGDMASNSESFDALNIKTLSITNIAYDSVVDMHLIAVPLTYSPALLMKDFQDSKEIINFSIEILEKFKKIPLHIQSDIINENIYQKVFQFISSNKKLNNIFNLNLDIADEKVLAYDGGVCTKFYSDNKKQIEFLSASLRILLEFFDTSVRNEFIRAMDDKDQLIKLARNSWYTLLEVYKEKSLSLYEKDIKELQANTSMTDFEKEYMLTSIQNEKEKLLSTNFFEYIDLIDDPNFLIKYWPFTNISLEASDTIITNIGTSSASEKFSDAPKKSVILGTDYFLKLIKIINLYLSPNKISIENGFKLFSSQTEPSLANIKANLVDAKKKILVKRKDELLSYLQAEKNENEEQEIKDEIQEIIDIVNNTQRDIDNLHAELNTTDIIDFWPAALYPIPDELDPNK